ncbi:hypothetical protein AVEN_55790-1 [Araneus ventricosus]|uniref:MADF domain-containing protein n=1 Tax=Araneus ventricosus TaxID=182803 RepID=A0A4Y2EYX4_ARAVE|nr:hypothetical protein AVEN_55790-1 [Araneus ventricosus]
MEHYLDGERMILEVAKYPCLYDISCNDFINHDFKRNAWIAVTKSLIGEKWDQMDEITRSTVGKEVQNRWKNLKDSFLRSLRNELGKSGNAQNTKKPYLYHKKMSFLEAVYGQRETLGNMNADEGVVNTEASEAPAERADEPVIVASSRMPKKRQTDPLEKEVLRNMNADEGVVNTEASEAPAERADEPVIVASSRMPKKRQTDPFEKEVLKVTQANMVQQDADEMFLLSQLPYIKTMRKNDKLQFQIQFLQLIQAYSNTYESTAVQYPAPCPLRPRQWHH